MSAVDGVVYDDDQLADVIESAVRAEPEPENPWAEQLFAAAAPAPPPIANLVVVGSYRWPSRVIVQAVMLEFAARHPGHQLQLWTSAADGGAEAFAREYAQLNGWLAQQVSNDDLVGIDAARVAFVLPGTDAERIARQELASAQVYTYEVLEQKTRWSSR